ncbi:MAG: 2-oxoacid:ferredoxin oxidoreductase subunit beta [Hyphomicrobiales bacterium]
MNQSLTAKDFTSDQEVRWCPGCGDYAILKAMRSTLAEIGRAPHEVALISGIGCAARFPYYVSSYGFHTIHGRAPAVATGVKLANPELDVWVIGGDGDFLSIGGNHLIHALRRNVDLNLMLINNAIYGLTKGQYSPTSSVGTRSPSTPSGSVDTPMNAAALALGAGARFIARSADTLLDHLPGMLKRAHAHKGASLVEIFQNCIVYNDQVWKGMANKKTSAVHVVRAEHGEPLIFGAERENGLSFDGHTGSMRLVEAGSSEVTLHDETNHALASALVRMNGDDMPTAIGVLYCAPDDSFGASIDERTPYQHLSKEDFRSICLDGRSWTV